MASDYQALVEAQAKVALATRTFSVALPCLVNTVPIMAGKEVILKWKAQPDKRKAAPKPERTAFDQIAQEDKRQRKAKSQST